MTYFSPATIVSNLRRYVCAVALCGLLMLSPCHRVVAASPTTPTLIVSGNIEYLPQKLYPGECGVRCVRESVVSAEGFGIDRPVDPQGRVVMSRSVEIYGKVYRVTEVSWGAFEGCHLDSLRLPSTVTAIGDVAFAGAEGCISVPGSVDVIGHYAFSGLRGSVVIEEGVRHISDNAFGGLTPIDGDEASRTIVVPSTVETLGRTILGTSLGGDNDAAISFLQCHALTPPEIEEGPDGEADLCSSAGSYRRIRLYVPDGSLDLYRNAPGWRKFSEIRPLSDSGVMSVAAEVDVTIATSPGHCLILSDSPEKIAVKIYNADGRQVYFGHDREIPLSPGLYIVRAAAASAKIVVN